MVLVVISSPQYHLELFYDFVELEFWFFRGESLHHEHHEEHEVYSQSNHVYDDSIVKRENVRQYCVAQMECMLK